MTEGVILSFAQPEAMQLYNQGCLAMQAGKAAEAASLFRRTLMIEPDSLIARYNLGAALERAGDLTGAIATYRLCVSNHPGHLDSAYNLASLLADSGAHHEAVLLFEGLCDRFPDESKLRQNLVLAKWRLRFGEAVAAEAGGEVRRVLVACMPKSGSTWLADVLAKLPGMQRAHLVPDYGRREQELDLEQLINHQGLSYVSQLHLRPSKLTKELLSGFRVKVVFLYRDIWDVMASLRDHMHTHSMDWSMARIEPAFRDWEEGRQYEFLARAMMPWFIDFYVSWSHEPEKLAVSYEALMTDPQATVARIAAWSGIAASAAEIGRALGDAGRAATFNKGGSGRGATVPAAARAHVEALAACYPDVDFTPLMGR
jgi:tetratricopeptide (TPR) repeat protein